MDTSSLSAPSYLLRLDGEENMEERHLKGCSWLSALWVWPAIFTEVTQHPGRVSPRGESSMPPASRPLSLCPHTTWQNQTAHSSITEDEANKALPVLLGEEINETATGHTESLRAAVPVLTVSDISETA